MNPEENIPAPPRYAHELQEPINREPPPRYAHELQEPINREPLEAEFIERLQAALRRGAAEYGDDSFKRAPAESVDQVLAELVDVAGWAFVLWVQLKRRFAMIERDFHQQVEQQMAAPLLQVDSETGEVKQVGCPTCMSLTATIGQLTEEIGKLQADAKTSKTIGDAFAGVIGAAEARTRQECQVMLAKLKAARAKGVQGLDGLIASGERLEAEAAAAETTGE